MARTISATIENVTMQAKVNRLQIRQIKNSISIINFETDLIKIPKSHVTCALSIISLPSKISRTIERTVVYIVQTLELVHKALKKILVYSSLNKKSYKVYLEITEEDLMKKERFLTDYHTLQYIARNSGLTIPDTATVINNLSNLLHLCEEYQVDEIHAVSMRIVRIVKNGKTYFLITEYAR